MNLGHRYVAATLFVAVGLLSTAIALHVTQTDGSDERLDLVLGDPANGGASKWPGAFLAPLVSHDLNGDGRLEVIGHSTDTYVYVFDSQNGRVLAKLPTTYPRSWHIEQVSNGVEVASLSAGEPPSLLIANHAAYVAAWTLVPDQSTKDDLVFEKRWEVRMDDCHDNPGMDAKAVASDVDGDGEVEIMIQTEENGLYALRADGTTLWQRCWSGGNAAPTIRDLDGDDRPEAIFASDSGFLSVFDAATGTPLWTFDATRHGIFPASIPVTPTVADLDGVGPMEILFVARHAPTGDADSFDTFNMAIFAVHQDPETWKASLLWMRQPDWANPLSYSHLVVQDADGDGQMDIFGMDWNTIGHRPGDWERLGPAHVFRLDEHGEDVWVREIDAWWSNKDLALVDTDGDGIVEVLANGPHGASDGLWILSSETGETKGTIETNGWKLQSGPTFWDLDGDGTLELILRATDEDEHPGRGAILVYDLKIGQPGISRPE